jgi:hypothetical protein
MKKTISLLSLSLALMTLNACVEEIEGIEPGATIDGIEGLTFYSADYEGNNVFLNVMDQCRETVKVFNGGISCTIVPSKTLAHDPAYGQYKRFVLRYRCHSEKKDGKLEQDPVSTGVPVTLQCFGATSTVIQNPR